MPHLGEVVVKPFVVNRYGRIVFPFNFFPELDFSVFGALDQFAAVIKRDFEEKAPSETDLVARLEAQEYRGRYDLLRDLALNLFWVNRYAMTMYEKRPPAGATLRVSATTSSSPSTTPCGRA
jgi:hypothetical protein